MSGIVVVIVVIAVAIVVVIVVVVDRGDPVGIDSACVWKGMEYQDAGRLYICSLQSLPPLVSGEIELDSLERPVPQLMWYHCPNPWIPAIS